MRMAANVSRDTVAFEPLSWCVYFRLLIGEVAYDFM